MQNKRRRNDLLTAVGIFVLAACGGTGSCAGCDLEPLPEGELPAGQTIEGAAQARVTPAGFDKISELVPAIFNEVLADGICIPRQSGSFLGVGYEFCHRNHCVTEDSNPGCQIDVELNAIDVSAPDSSTLRIGVDFDGEGDVPARYGWANCTFELEGEEVFVEADIYVDVDARTGELEVGLDGIPDIDLSGLDISGCSFVSGFASLVKDTIAEYIIDYLSPFIDNFIQGLLPDPLGLEGVLDATPFITEFRPPSEVALELRTIPGGHADLENDGLNLGLIAGLNTDYEPEDRSFGNATTPAPCVPPIGPLDFSVAPYELPRTARGTYRLPPAGAFVGDRDPGDHDVILGVSETALNLAGYHAFASGALCLGLDSGMVPQLNLGTIGILVPSLSELGSEQGGDPLLVVMRPQRPLEATVGEGGGDAPNLTIHIDALEIDIYAFIFERWVRGFTLKVDLDLGLGMELITDDAGRPALLPTLSGLDTESIGIEILNPEFLREDKDSLETVIPALFDLVVPRIGRGLGSFALPEFAGFTLTDLEVARITTDEDDFLSIAGAFGSSSVLEALADEYPALREHAAARVATPPDRVVTRAQLAGVSTPAPERVSAALSGDSAGSLPEVVIDVDPHDASGRSLEWTWRIDGGMWRPFTDAAPLVIRDRAFAFQGHYEIEVAARVRGDYETLDLDPESFPVIIDSVAPEILIDRAHVAGDRLIVPAKDAVTPPARIERALARPNAAEPATPFATGPLDLADARELAGPGGAVRVFARDEAGNQSHATIEVDELSPATGGCHAAATARGGLNTGAAILVGLAAFALLRRRALRAPVARVGVLAAAAAGWIVSAGCGSSASGGMCVEDDECAAHCGEGELPVCVDGECLCDDDVPLGRVGQYSAVALDSTGHAWVSAYNSTYGDLVVARVDSAGRVPRDAWEFVDGVPDGPVIVENSRVRGGVFRRGPNLGLHTDIAVSRDDVALVSYFDKDAGSLKLAMHDGSDWDIHVVDAGEVGDTGDAYVIAGQYSALTLDPDGRPGIAYLAHSSAGDDTEHTELRFAQAASTTPRSASNWQIFTVDEATVATAESDDDPYPIPPGVGLYVAADRYQDGRPVLVYYDRIDGALRLAEMSPGGTDFEEPTVLDDGDGFDVGRFPSVAVDNNDNVHVSYVNASRSELLYLDASTHIGPEVVDDGYRIIGTNDDGAPIPDFHFVGDDSSLVITAFGPVIAYQDATTHQLLLAQHGDDGEWARMIIAGNTESFEGGYGFYASSAFDGTSVLISNWVLDQPNRDSWVELHRRVVID